MNLGQETGYHVDLDLGQQTGYHNVLNLGQENVYYEVLDLGQETIMWFWILAKRLTTLRFLMVPRSP